jgi:methyltransferase-like protein/SAM-dependent methyltransferase
MTDNSYESLPYTSVPYHQTHIAHLHTVGRLFNLIPADVRHARVLELGCAAGGNIMPMADQYPESTFLGIDLSPTQIREGQALIAELGLPNMVLRAESILDFPESAGQFDYIICHGTFSWVPADVRDKILDIAHRHLAPQGLALISYNAFPGWYGPSILRDMMVFHTAAYPSPAEKVAESRKLLQMIAEAQVSDAEGYRGMVQAELDNIRSSRDEYVFHEYLEENNKPFYFQEFVTMANAHQLAHLSDSDLGLMHLANYTPSVRQFVAGMRNPLRVEQYLDFVNNTRFRRAIMVHKELTVDRAFDATRVEEFWLHSEARPDGPEPKPPLPAALTLNFICPNNLRFATHDAPGAAVLLTLFRNRGRAMRVSDVVAEAKQRYELPQPEAELRRRLCEFALRLALSRVIVLRSDPGRHVTAVSAKPVGLPLARVLARHSLSVPNALHEVVVLDQACQFLLPRLDGSADRAALAQLVGEALGRGALTARYELKLGAIPLSGTALAEALLHHALTSLAENALLIG